MRVVRRGVIATVVLVVAAAPVAAGGFPTADLSVTKTDTPDPVAPGGNITYEITVQNLGPGDAPDVNWSDAPPIGTTTFVSLTTPAGWTATTPPVGGTGSVSATHPNLTVGTWVFILVVQVNAGVANGTVLSNFTSVVSASSSDPVSTNNSSTADTTVAVPATPVPSVPDAAMSEPGGLNPAVPLAVLAILLASLVLTAVLRGRPSRT